MCIRDSQGVSSKTTSERKGAMILLLFVGVIVFIGAVAVAFESGNLMASEEIGRGEAIFYVSQEYISIAMFLTLAILLFSGYPVAFILGGLSMLFGMLGYYLDMFSLIEFFNFVPRIWGMAAENLVLVAVPAFVYMGVMLERSGIANDLLYCVQVLLRRVPGALALAVTVMGTILAAMTGIIGASVTMMTALALPTMMRQGYSHALATGVIAASGTLGILIPPSIMLIIMADLMAISVGNVFMAAVVPGLTLAAFYLIYVATLASIKPSLAPPLPANLLNIPKGEMVPLVLRSFLPPVFLITLIKGSILFGFATPSEAGAVGAFGATLLAARKEMGKYGLNPSEVVYIVSQAMYYDLLSDSAFQSLDEVGTELAIKVTGTIGAVFGSPVVVSEEFAAEAAGVPVAFCVYPRNYVLPRLRGVTVEQDYEVMNQRRVIVATQSLGFNEIVAGASGDQPSIKIDSVA